MALRYEESLAVKDLKSYEGALFVQNETNQIVSFDDREHVLRIDPKGGEEDFVALDRAIANNLGFQKIWRQGMVTVFKDGHADDEMTERELRTMAARRRQAEKNDSDLVTEPAGSRDLSTDETCIECGTPVYRSQAEIRANDAPPLCEVHEDNVLDWTFTQKEGPDGPITQWIPASTGETLTDTK